MSTSDADNRSPLSASTPDLAAHPPSGSRLFLSQIAPGRVQSEIRQMSIECDRVGGINLAQGICDTPVPEPVLAGAEQAMRAGHNIYTRLDGIARLRSAIADKQRRDYNLDFDPEREILVTSGATGGFHAAAQALLNPGDEVLLFEPFYGYYLAILRAQRVVPVVVPLSGPDFALDLEALGRAISPRTRALVLNSPANPSGKVFTPAEFEALAAFVSEHDLFVFTDEIYEYFVYDGARHVPFVALEGMRERTIQLSGFSKTFSVTGWRVGFLTASERWRNAIAYFHDLTYVCAPAPLQHGVAAGLEQLPPAFYSGLASDHQNKRARILAALEAAGLPPTVPAGAYYILADASRLPGTTAAERARFLLAETGVAAVAGSAFLLPGRGEHLLRFCFAKRDQELDEACQRLRRLR